MKKKLIEVALPLEAINRESVREKSSRQGHPSTLHLWWARRPLAACRAVIFASLVDDPSSLPEQFPTEAEQDLERLRLFKVLEELVKWDNSNNKAVLDRAKAEILRSTGGHPPSIYDPFCGGGSIPLEAQRLGLNAFGSDLNPVAVLITKAQIEIPSKFAGQPPINPSAKTKLSAMGMWADSSGLADDVRYYGNWMRDTAKEKLGEWYPTARIEDKVDAKVIAWIWAKTVTCPNPACGANMPLIRSFTLRKKGEQAWVSPILNHSDKTVQYEIRTGPGAPVGTKLRGRSRCIFCGTTMSDAELRSQCKEKGLKDELIAIAAEGKRRRIYLAPQQVEAINSIPEQSFDWLNQSLSTNSRWFSPPGYGLFTFGSLYNKRQLQTLIELVNLVGKARHKAIEDGATSDRADAIATYLALIVDRVVMTCNNLVRWNSTGEKAQHAFGRQALPMIWDYAEPNPFATATGSIAAAIELVVGPLGSFGKRPGFVSQRDAASLSSGETERVICTDPPYYDNIGYSDLSDFFYLWLRRSLADIYPQLFSTLLVPKQQELVASSHRFGGDEEVAKRFFEEGFGRAFSCFRKISSAGFPLTVYYAFKQAEETEDDEEALGGSGVSTGWETMLEGLLRTGFQVTATWPMHTEMKTRQVAMGTNALASCIVLACRPRSESASITTRKDFLTRLKRELPCALRDLQKGNVAPVDMAQAAIGPGMAVFSRYSRVLESNGESMSVRTALGLINQMLDEVLSEQESDFDPDTRWALQWFEQYQFNEAPFGQAETLASAKAVSIHGLQESGILLARAGKVRLIPRDELDPTWDPTTDGRLTIWETTQHLIRVLETQGEPEAAQLKAKLGGAAEAARELAYRLYALCERKGWAQEAGAYNNLVVRWPDLRSDEFSLS